MKIAFFKEQSDFSTNPTLDSLCRALSGAGDEIDIYMPMSGDFPLPEYANARCLRLPRFHHQARFWSPHPRRTTANLMRYIAAIAAFRKRAYDVLVGIDSGGIVVAAAIARRLGIPLAYFSFEMVFRDELDDMVHIREKALEAAASRHAGFILIQDPLRGRLLARENGIDDDFVYVPVAPEGGGCPQRNDSLRKRYGIPETSTIVIHSGSFAHWTCAEELMASVNTWPDGFVLLIHTRQRLNADNSYAKMLLECERENVIVSTEPLGTEEYGRMLASADIGLVLYQQREHRYLGKNLMNIGLASGKFSSYMKFGLPVVCIAHQDTYAKLLEEYRFGIDLPDFGAMPAALIEVRDGIEGFRSEAFRIFGEKLDFNLYKRPLLQRLYRLAGRDG